MKNALLKHKPAKMFQMALKVGKQSKRTYLFLKDTNGAYHALVEVDAIKAMRDCGQTERGNTRTLGKKLLGF